MLAADGCASAYRDCFCLECVCVCVSVCMSVCLFDWLSVYMSVCLDICMSVCVCVCVSHHITSTESIHCAAQNFGVVGGFGGFTCNCQKFTIQMHHITSHNIRHYVQPPKYYHSNVSSSFIRQKQVDSSLPKNQVLVS